MSAEEVTQIKAEDALQNAACCAHCRFQEPVNYLRGDCEKHQMFVGLFRVCPLFEMKENMK